MNVSEHFVPQLTKLVVAAREVLPRLATDDTEAIHDLRVALRRLRSLLRPLREVYGWKAVTAVREKLRTIGDASSPLRDEEVLGEILAALGLPAATRTSLKRWQSARAHEVSGLREAFVSELSNGGLETALADVEMLLSAPPKRKRDKNIVRFARKIVLGAQRDIEDLLLAGRSDVESLHDLRIAYKRLRYAVEGVEEALAPELVAMREVATKMQKRLGDLHDLDVVHQTLSGAPELSSQHRAVLLEALVARRAHVLRKFQEEAGPRADVFSEGLAVTALPDEPSEHAAPEQVAEPEEHKAGDVAVAEPSELIAPEASPRIVAAPEPDEPTRSERRSKKKRNA